MEKFLLKSYKDLQNYLDRKEGWKIKTIKYPEQYPCIVSIFDAYNFGIQYIYPSDFVEDFKNKCVTDWGNSGR